VKLDFGLSPSNLDDAAKKAWGFEFGLIYSVTLGREGLTTSIVVRNEGETAWDFQVLMHTYFRIKVIFPSTVERGGNNVLTSGL
jgi:glucose-6-phosphate 1-epimerase